MKSIPLNDSGKFLTDQCKQIDINDFVHRASKQLKKELIQMNLELEGCQIQLSTSELSHGGIRYWLNCPICNKRSGKLFKHPISKLIACRKCNKLEYRCRRYKGMIESSL